MTLENVEKRSRALMIEHGLTDWDFHYDKATRRLGATWINLKRISISRKFAQTNTWPEIKETMLHEIAHALTGEGHTKKWKQAYADIGGDTRRTYENLKRVGMITGTCPKCKGKTKRYRSSYVTCGKCCRKYNKGQFSAEFLLSWGKR